MKKPSRTISRVMSRMIICLAPPSPATSSDPPESSPGRLNAFCSVLLRMGFTCALPVTVQAVVSYTAFPPLPQKFSLAKFWQNVKLGAVYFCCTGLGVTSTGRYPASCPVKPGLSSPESSAAIVCLTCCILILLHFPAFVHGIC